MGQFWLVKTEPASYSWKDFVQDGAAAWTGVRNYQARNNLRAMKQGDLVLFYHSVSDKNVVGVATVSREHYADPTAEEGDWSCVELKPLKPLAEPVSLATLKADSTTIDMPLIKNSRISVVPVSESQYRRVLELAKTR